MGMDEEKAREMDDRLWGFRVIHALWFYKETRVFDILFVLGWVWEYTLMYFFDVPRSFYGVSTPLVRIQEAWKSKL